MIENIPLFDLFTPETATALQLLDALNNGIDPRTGEEDDSLADVAHELRYLWTHRPEHTPIGTFSHVTEWNGGDGRERGKVIKHEESGILLMTTGTYSSWDSDDWGDWAIAEPYTFTETRYRAS